MRTVTKLITARKVMASAYTKTPAMMVRKRFSNASATTLPTTGDRYAAALNACNNVVARSSDNINTDTM